MDKLQYKNKEEFYNLHEKIGSYNLAEYYKFFPKKMCNGNRILDIGCGEGNDMKYFKTLGAEVCGIDINPIATEIAKKELKLDDNFVKTSEANSLLFKNNSFDIASSNYVLQAIPDIAVVYKETARVLKQGGKFIFLATHPMRQYFEKKNSNSDYFNQETVDSVILNGTVTVQEPTHTFNDYFSEYFLKHFKIEKFIELHDPTAEKVDGRKYPGFFIVSCVKI
ncbi:MAG: class I SAM-dependent methyltransferase [bacterium]